MHRTLSKNNIQKHHFYYIQNHIKSQYHNPIIYTLTAYPFTIKRNTRQKTKYPSLIFYINNYAICNGVSELFGNDMILGQQSDRKSSTTFWRCSGYNSSSTIRSNKPYTKLKLSEISVTSAF